MADKAGKIPPPGRIVQDIPRVQKHSMGEPQERVVRAVEDRRTGERRNDAADRRGTSEVSWRKQGDVYVSGRRVWKGFTDRRQAGSDRRVGAADRRAQVFERRGAWQPSQYPPAYAPDGSNVAWPSPAPVEDKETEVPVAALEQEPAASRMLPIQEGESTFGGKLQGDIVRITKGQPSLPTPSGKWTAEWYAWAREDLRRFSKGSPEFRARAVEIFRGCPELTRFPTPDSPGWDAHVAFLLALKRSGPGRGPTLKAITEEDLRTPGAK